MASGSIVHINRKDIGFIGEILAFCMANSVCTSTRLYPCGVSFIFSALDFSFRRSGRFARPFYVNCLCVSHVESTKEVLLRLNTTFWSLEIVTIFFIFPDVVCLSTGLR